MPLPLRHAETWVFDLDNTLYDAATDLFRQIDRRMRDFIAGYLDVEADEAFRIQKTYFRQYGTTLRGLMAVHGLDPGPYLAHVHDVDVSVVPPAPALGRALARLPGRKIVFTNASTAHAHRILERLGVGRHFEAVFDIAAAGYVPKPEPTVYEALLRCHAIAPGRAVMVEDIARNLAPAAALGMTTVWVRTGHAWGLDDEGGEATPGYVHHATDDLVAWLDGL